MFCNNCGSKIDSNSKFCGACGKAVEISFVPHENSRKESSKISFIFVLNVILITLAVCLAVCIVVASVYLHKESEKLQDYDVYESVCVE